MENLIGKHFSITDPQGVNTVIYQINKTEKELLENYPKYTVERLDYTEEFNGNNKKKTFFIDNPSDTGDNLVILSFSGEKVVINMGVVENDKIRISKSPVPMKFDTLYSEEENVYKEFSYTPNFKRPISIAFSTYSFAQSLQLHETKR